MKPVQPKHVIAELHTRGLLELVDDVCLRRGVTRDELCGPRRSRAITAARHELWGLIHEHPERLYSYSDVARLFRRDHSSVLHGVAAHRRRQTPAPLLDRGGA